jgi:hypothetical protein
MSIGVLFSSVVATAINPLAGTEHASDKHKVPLAAGTYITES